jgi:hypothetical protein
MAGTRKRAVGDPFRQLTTLRMVVIAILVAGVGAVLLFVSSLSGLKGHPAWEGLLSPLGGVLIAAVAITLLWELLGKRAFAGEVFAIARVGTDVRNAALTRIGTSYLDDVDWEWYFATVEKLDVFVAYGSTWRGANFQRLRHVAAQPTSRLRVFLPNPHDAARMSTLAERFSMADADVVARIQDARTEFAGLQQVGGGDVRVYYHSGDPLFSCYRFDRTAILTLYSHTRTRTNVPTIVCRDGGTLYDFVREELRAIEDQSRLADEVEQEAAG